MSAADHRTKCRLCMRQPGSYNIFTASTRPDTTLTVAARITWVTQIEMSIDDGHSSVICGQCSIQLDAAYSFIEQCLATDKAIHGLSDDDEEDEPVMNCPIAIKQEVTYDDSNGALAGSSSAQPSGMIQKFETPTFALTYSESEPLSFLCAICEGVFKSKDSYFTHIRLHAREKPNIAYECSKCKRIFNCPSHLKRHMRSHSGDKPYKCTMCPKDFYRMDHLKKHVMSHTGERPWSCTICPKAFARRDHLMNHVKIHDKSKPFECSLCDKSFFKESGMVKHMKTHATHVDKTVGLTIAQAGSHGWKFHCVDKTQPPKASHEPALWRQALQAHHVSERLLSDGPLEEARDVAHGRAALAVHDLPEGVCLTGPTDEPRQDPRQGQAV